MKCNLLIEAFEGLAPLSFQEEWDNCGLLIGSAKKEIKKVYIALDATDEVIEDAIAKEVDVLLTHHPLIFKGLKSITDEEMIGRRVMKLLTHNMTYYAMHTNFDVAVMADLAADYLKLTNQEILDRTQECHGIGKIGFLPYEMDLSQLCEYIKDAFELENVKVFGQKEKIKKVVIMPGSGKSYIKNAIQVNADVMITGDIDHHTGIDAVAEGLVVIDASHYGIEHIFVNYMKEFIEDKFSEIKVYKEERKMPFHII